MDQRPDDQVPAETAASRADPEPGADALVDEESAESFPASDAPSWWAGDAERPD